MKRRILSTWLVLALVLSLGLASVAPVAVSAADGDVVLVDFGPTPRTPSLEGTITHDGSNLNFSVAVLEQDVADDDYLAFWIDPDYSNKDLSGMVNQFDSPWNEDSKLLMLNFFVGNLAPEWGDGTDGNCPWMQKSETLPAGVSLTYIDTDDGMNWEDTIPFSVLGVNSGDTFGYMFSARIKTDAKYVDGYPEMVYGVTSGWDLRDYAVVTILPPPTEVLVDGAFTETTPGWGYDRFAAIQGGINAVAEGGTVNVAAGTYNENIVVNKSLTLEGANAGVPATVERSPESVIDAQSAEVAVSIDEVETVVIDGFAVSGFSKAGIVAKNVTAVKIEGNAVSATDHEAAPNGIQVGYVMDPTATTGTVKDNLVSGCSWKDYDPTRAYEAADPINWSGSGILVIAPDSALEISGNEVESCDVGMDIEAGAGTSVTGNDVHDNSYGFVLWNAFPAISQNSICQNPQGGVYRTTEGSLELIVDATNNWWGQSSGPGDAISGNVSAEPWLLTVEGLTDENLRYDKTRSLPTGWLLVSPGTAIQTDGVFVDVELVLEYTGEAFISDILEFSPPSPLKAIYVKALSGGGGVGVNYAVVEPGVIYSKELMVGWNLISVPDTIASTQGVLAQLRYVTIGTQQGIGLTTLVSQSDYNQNSDGFNLSAIGDADFNDLPQLSPLDGYWAHMEAGEIFEVIPD